MVSRKTRERILKENKELFKALEEYDKTGKPISRIIEEKL